MANTKKKSNVKNSNNKKNNNSINLNKKVSTTKKKIEVSAEVKKRLKETELVKKPTKKKIENKIETIEKKVLTPEEIAKEKKERNRKKYEKGQQKYQTTKAKPKKKIEITTEIKDIKKKIDVYDEANDIKKKLEIPEEIRSKKKKVIKEEKLVKKTNVIDNTVKIKEKERKQKRKTNTKTSGFTQTLTNIKKFSTTQIDIFKEKANDSNIPVGKTEEDKKNRFKRFIKESIVGAILLTIFNILCILIFDYFDFLRLFDVKALNIVITIIISLIFNFFIAFMIDHFVTKIWLKKRHIKKDDDVNGDNRINKGKYRRNIKNKEGK